MKRQIFKELIYEFICITYIWYYTIKNIYFAIYYDFR